MNPSQVVRDVLDLTVGSLGSSTPEHLRKGIARVEGIEGADGLADKTIFPSGRLPFKPSSLATSKYKKAYREAIGNGEAEMKIAPAEVHNLQLRRIPGGAEKFVRDLRENYERDKDKLPYKIQWEKRNRDVPVIVSGEGDRSYYLTGKNEHIGHGLKRGNPLDGKMIRYNGFDNAEQVEGTGEPNIEHKSRILAHELTHSWAVDLRRRTRRSLDWHAAVDGAKLRRSEILDRYNIKAEAGEPKVAYQASFSTEYLQGAVAGFNILRDVTGQRFDQPQMMHQALDEMVANPKIVDQLPIEPARIFRTYLHLNQHNPELGERLREALARDCQYLGDASGLINGKQEEYEEHSNQRVTGMEEKIRSVEQQIGRLAKGGEKDRRGGIQGGGRLERPQGTLEKARVGNESPRLSV